MFRGFARVWTPVAVSRELGERPLGLTIADTKVVLFRDAEGRPAALVDRCPHRGVALSLGQVREGCLRCPFHGWELDRDARVTHVPWNPEAKLETLRGVALPVRELAGQLWVYTAPRAPETRTPSAQAPERKAGRLELVERAGEPSTEPEVHEALLRPDVRVSGFAIDWETHWTRAMENMLDWPHLPFVHAGTIGRGMLRRREARMDVVWEERPWGAHTTIRIDGEDQPGALDFRWPNQMNLHIPVRGKLLMMLVAAVPVAERKTRMLLTMARGFLRSPLFDWFFHRTNLRIATEDQAIVESSHPAEVPPPGDERSVRTDGPTLAFRKRYYAELRDRA